MLYWLIELSNTVPILGFLKGLLNVFRYITFRTGGAAVTLGFGFVGFYDDYLKVTQQTHSGFAGKLRLLIEGIIAVAACYMLVRLGRDAASTSLAIPFLKDVVLNFGWFFVIFGAFVIVGAGNAVN